MLIASFINVVYHKGIVMFELSMQLYESPQSASKNADLTFRLRHYRGCSRLLAPRAHILDPIYIYIVTNIGSYGHVRFLPTGSGTGRVQSPDFQP